MRRLLISTIVLRKDGSFSLLATASRGWESGLDGDSCSDVAGRSLAEALWRRSLAEVERRKVDAEIVTSRACSVVVVTSTDFSGL